MGSTTATPPPWDTFRRGFLIALTVLITLLFVLVIRPFLLAVLLAAIFSGMAHPLYVSFLRLLRGRKAWASVSTIAVILLVVGLPLLLVLGLVASQAVELSQGAGPWIERRIADLDGLDRRLAEVPFLADLPGLRNLIPTGQEIVVLVGEAASALGSLLFGSLAAVTRATVGFLLQLFIVFYAMFFFLIDGRATLDRILFYVPLAPVDDRRLLERFVSVTRATIKGSLLIGIIQGVLAGLAFQVVGVAGAAFWGAVTAVVSVIPAVGVVFVWGPVVVYLGLTGHPGAALGLLVWSALVVSTVDNFLRPRLVGRDARMPDLLILLSTFGGLALFGPAGFIVGPIVAALFVTVWHLFGEAFRERLPAQVPD